MRTMLVLSAAAVTLVISPNVARAQDGSPGPKFVGYFSGAQNGCPNGGAIYATGSPAVYSFVCNGVNGKAQAFSSFEEVFAGLPCTLPNGTQHSIKIVVSNAGAVSLNCGDPPRYVDNQDGTVTDTMSGLIWTKQAGCFGDRIDYELAVVQVAALANGQCGLTDGSKPGDWRLPGPEEFLRVTRTAREMGCSRPALTDDSGFGCFGNGSASSFIGVEGLYLGFETPWADGSGRRSVPLLDVTFPEVVTFPYSVPGRVWPVRVVPAR